MSTWARTSNGSGDMFFPPNGQGAEAIVTDPELEVQIKIPSVLKFVLGEWKLDTSKGFPWPAIWAQKSPNLISVRQQIRKAILAIPLVASIKDLALTFQPALRNFIYQWAVKLVSGQTASGP